MDEQKDPLQDMEARVERLAERVIVPETMAPNATLELFGHRLPARPLPMKYAKRLHQQTRSLWTEIAEIIAVREGTIEEKSVVLSKYPDVDQHASEALVRCVGVISDFYRIPDVTPDLIEETYTVPQMLKIVAFQIGLNEADDFLLQPLRLTLAVMGSIPVLASAIRVGDSPALPSSTAGPKPGASPSMSS